MPQAAGLAAAIEKNLGLEAELVEGGGGTFEVTVDGELIYSKLQEGCFPEQEEVLSEIEKRM